jgi:hypothetical protein
MDRLRSRRSAACLVLSLMTAAGTMAGFGVHSASATPTPTKTVITVTLTAYRVRLSATKNVPLGTVEFRLVNRGKLARTFSIGGKTSSRITPGRTGKLTVVFRKAGSFSYFSAVAGQGARGVGGTLAIRQAVDVMKPPISSWTALTGFGPLLWRVPRALVGTPDGSVYIAAASGDVAHSPYVYHEIVTSLDAQDAQGPVASLGPEMITQQVAYPIAAPRRGGASVLAGVSTFWQSPPPGVSADGIVAWTLGPSGWMLGDLLPGPGLGKTPVYLADGGPQPLAYAEAADGTPFTLVRSVAGGDFIFDAVRGAGAGATHSRLALGAGCTPWRGNLVSAGRRLWLAWFQDACFDPTADRAFVAPVDPATGAVGTGVPVPVPEGYSRPINLYEHYVFPLAARPGQAGAWTAYEALCATGRRASDGSPVGDAHLFLYHIGDVAAVDLGVVAKGQGLEYNGRVTLAATPTGRLWIGWAAAGDIFHVRRTSRTGSSFDRGEWTIAFPNGLHASDLFGLIGPEAAAAGEALEVVAQTPDTVYHLRLGDGFLGPNQPS